MPDGLRQYIVECLREAPLAWRKGAIIMTVVINSAMLGLIYFGAQLRSYPTAYFLIGTAALAALDVILIFPFKLWRANKQKLRD
jgi:hypothetical protein